MHKSEELLMRHELLIMSFGAQAYCIGRRIGCFFILKWVWNDAWNPIIMIQYTVENVSKTTS